MSLLDAVSALAEEWRTRYRSSFGVIMGGMTDHPPGGLLAACAALAEDWRSNYRMNPQERGTIPMTTPPTVCRMVHYVSYGTPGGEYASVCRAAMVTEVGAWIVTSTGAEEVMADGTRQRTVDQVWYPDACALTVSNPTGLFLGTCRYDPGQPSTQPGGPLWTYAGGTWHWPERVEETLAAAIPLRPSTAPPVCALCGYEAPGGCWIPAPRFPQFYIHTVSCGPAVNGAARVQAPTLERGPDGTLRALGGGAGRPTP